MGRELAVQHRTGLLSCTQVFQLLRFKRPARMFIHKSPLFNERHARWWRRISGN
jgi:hypothetical protein